MFPELEPLNKTWASFLASCSWVVIKLQYSVSFHQGLSHTAQDALHWGSHTSYYTSTFFPANVWFAQLNFRGFKCSKILLYNIWYVESRSISSSLWAPLRLGCLWDIFLSMPFHWYLSFLFKYASVKSYLIAPLLAHKYLLNIYYVPSKWK